MWCIHNTLCSCTFSSFKILKELCTEGSGIASLAGLPLDKVTHVLHTFVSPNNNQLPFCLCFLSLKLCTRCSLVNNAVSRRYVHVSYDWPERSVLTWRSGPSRLYAPPLQSEHKDECLQPVATSAAPMTRDEKRCCRILHLVDGESSRSGSMTPLKDVHVRHSRSGAER